MVWGGSTQAQQDGPSFELSLAAPASISGPAGGVVSYEATGSLTTNGLLEDEDGAQGWSVSVSADVGRVVGIGTDGTIVDAIFKGGFKKTELTTKGTGDCAGRAGAVSAVVLSFTEQVTLPPAGSADIVKVSLEADVPQPVVDPAGDPSCEPSLSRVFYVNACQGAGQPVENKVTWSGQTFLPTLGDATTSICPVVQKPVAFRVDVLDPAGTAGPPSGNVVPWTLNVPVGGGAIPVEVGAILVSNLPDDPDPLVSDGSQGWSMSVVTEECFGIQTASTDNTDVDANYSGGFKKTEIVDPGKNNGRHGAVSAVVLSFTEARFLDPVSESLVLRVRGSMDSSGLSQPGDATPACLVQLSDPATDPGLRGSGQPVKTAVTVQGTTRSPGVTGASIQLVGAGEGRFIRGNANNDPKIDIADAIWIVNQVFRSGPAAECSDAADATNDGRIDITDALFLVGYQFQGQSPPSAPFPGCGTDPEGDADGLDCATSQDNC